ncbi:Nifu-like protein, putative [Theileria annulata]|uniref:Nifu-like protein, putative n=1 Tax=Theileria annulata TaxID=5874 RepID=Q4UG22_THEAN|nr:Nifu-like protein, putative [Theileria annulata]CAI73967.1 Nifu-like protein, putative [Theileria annulata]|eukprot:XP_954644.1 Nifu-like protein, putative [Theileria annulata]
MYNLILFVFIILGGKYSLPWRLKSAHKLSYTIHKIRGKGFNLNSEPKDSSEYKPKDIEQTEYDEEGWLMDLNTKNVEDVFDLIRPQLSSDGGGINLCKIVDNEIYVKFTGSCVGCPYRSTTLKELIESNLVKFIKSPNENPITVKVVQEN